MFQLITLSGTVENIGTAALPVGTGNKLRRTTNRKMAQK
jgi:hypothetical protein